MIKFGGEAVDCEGSRLCESSENHKEESEEESNILIKTKAAPNSKQKGNDWRIINLRCGLEVTAGLDLECLRCESKGELRDFD